MSATSLFYDSRTVCSLKCYSLDPKLSKDGRVELAVPRAEFHVSNIDFKVFKDRFCLSTEMK